MKKLLFTTVTALVLYAMPALATEWNDTTCWSSSCQGTGVPDKHPKPDPTKDNCWSPKCHATGDPDGKPKPKPDPKPDPKPKPQDPEHRDPRDNTPTPAYSFLCNDQQDQTVYHVGFGHTKAQAKAEVDAMLAQLKADNKKLRNCNAEVEFFLRAAGHYNDK